MLKHRLEPQSLAWHPYRLELHHLPLHRQPRMWYDTFCRRVNTVRSLWHIHICFSYQWFADTDNILSWAVRRDVPCYSSHYFIDIKKVLTMSMKRQTPQKSHWKPPRTQKNNNTSHVPSKLMTWRPTVPLTNGLHLEKSHHSPSRTLCRCSISDSCDRVILASFSRFSLKTSHFPVATISFTSSSVTSLPDTSSCRIMKCLQRSCLVSRPSLYCSITWTSLQEERIKGKTGSGNEIWALFL